MRIWTMSVLVLPVCLLCFAGATQAQRGDPGSLLLFPEYDSQPGVNTRIRLPVRSRCAGGGSLRLADRRLHDHQRTGQLRVSAGDRRRYQYWYRTTTMSDATRDSPPPEIAGAGARRPREWGPRGRTCSGETIVR